METNKNNTSLNIQRDTIDENIQFISNNNQIDLIDLLKGILRKRKIFVVTLGLFFSSTIILTAYQRIYKPIYNDFQNMIPMI